MKIYLYPTIDILMGGGIQSIFSSEMTFIEVSEHMQIIKEHSDDVYSLHRVDSSSQSIVQLQINTLVPETEQYLWAGVINRQRDIMVPGVKRQLISNITVEKFGMYPRYAVPWIQFTSGRQQFIIYRPRTLLYLDEDNNEQKWLKTAEKFGEEMILLAKNLKNKDLKEKKNLKNKDLKKNQDLYF